MSAGQQDYLGTVENPADPINIPASLTAGIQDGFIFALIAAGIALIIAFFIKRVRVEH
jgi:DHA2 family lincomycin resistance protein-like MFS transporter